MVSLEAKAFLKAKHVICQSQHMLLLAGLRMSFVLLNLLKGGLVYAN